MSRIHTSQRCVIELAKKEAEIRRLPSRARGNYTCAASGDEFTGDGPGEEHCKVWIGALNMEIDVFGIGHGKASMDEMIV